ncbi:MAG: hypothetical protein P5702_16230 [Limnospira sp. PMC 1291.21]|uniref:hypothetical protein n=2 Tax=Limnospira TaxID=2596745 RepID=UPI0028E176DD|nr:MULTISPECIES: hypothetical protein [unclassified Limnospira]MDT9179044.1 hypothetical protein [Limnospira sp. PMC 1238.20]MDT9250711.1 hypothetical protein [Limnospira sp. PMC 1280.21]MDT9286227.1 hypothetical protein [Limnospira sp. PMC 1298.21]MDT9306838.1 hypothetical protein [Limnospira sp. PMC 1291.21]MDT9317065.1 hypothetical protein [Limnospira sp. PMC 1306.21]
MMVIFTGLGALSDGALRGVFINAIAFANQNLRIFTDILAVIGLQNSRNVREITVGVSGNLS